MRPAGSGRKDLCEPLKLSPWARAERDETRPHAALSARPLRPRRLAKRLCGLPERLTIDVDRRRFLAARGSSRSGFLA
jgi:hypothetical protein